MTRLQYYLEALQTNPLGFLLSLVYTAAALLISLMLHECAHGYMALRCGDPTAKMMGRLSLNPARHLDPMGTLFMFLFGFGWAKPVPVNPRNFRNYRQDDFLVSIAGIVTNLTIFLLCCALSVAVNQVMMGQELLADMAEGGYAVSFFTNPLENGGSCIMNGLDLTFDVYNVFGKVSHSFVLQEQFAVPWLQYVQRFLLLLAQMNLSLALFNLFPMPPLDGFHLLNDVVFRGRLQLSRQQFVIFQGALMLVLLSGLLDELLFTGVEKLYGAVLHVFLLIAGCA